MKDPAKFKDPSGKNPGRVLFVNKILLKIMVLTPLRGNEKELYL
jgi:hypothetical protein